MSSNEPTEKSTYVNAGTFYTIRSYRRFKYSPQMDITPYELALILPIAITFAVGNSFSSDCGDMVDALPEEAKRHFQEIDVSQQNNLKGGM
ncbi:hypothetical protein [Brucella tritici]|uniref:Uncharacterized protein n=1 Tax=Brucella tritici TaxID=94626 RepID=A0A6L3YVY7_9HYPH|nr:hypothetical protein [Brucella tritici]KAB2689679.1 hypothetical protein F9L08_03200 [Brucella tritici]